MVNWTIRDEGPGDAAAIAALTRDAFNGHPYSDGSEPAIVSALRAAGALTLSLVAVDDDDTPIGHAAFSPVTMGSETEGWFGLGPVSVAPAHQRHGIGSALIRAGLDALRAKGAQGCVVLGDPAFYRRFGFANDPAVTLNGQPSEHFMVLRLGAESGAGAVRFHAGFG